jgi:hypothetical protein
VTRLSMPSSEKQRITPLSVIEVQDLAGAMPDRCRAMVITQAGRGLRVAELLALRAQDVDFSGVRCGSNSRQPRMASTEYRPRYLMPILKTEPGAQSTTRGRVTEHRRNLITARRHRALSEASFLVVAGVGFEPT